MSDNGKQIEVKFGAEIAAFKSAMAELTGSVRSASDSIQLSMKNIAADSDRTEAKVKASASGISGAFQRMYSSISGGVGSVVGAFRSIYSSVFSLHTAMIGLVGGGIGAAIKGALESAAAIKDVAMASNTATDALQALRYAASQNGASAGLLDDALTKLNKNLGDMTKDAAGPAAEAFRQLGLEAAIMRGEFATSDEAMLAIARAMQAIHDPAQRAALASEIFGRNAGPRLAEFLALGEDGIRKFMTEAHNMGLVMSRDMIDAADNAADKLDALWGLLKTKLVIAVAENATEIEEFAQSLIDALPSIISATTELGKFLGILQRTKIESADTRLNLLTQQVNRLERLKAGQESLGPLDFLFEPALIEIDDIDAKIAELRAEMKPLQDLMNASNRDVPADDWDGTVTVTGRRPRGGITPPPGAGADDVTEQSIKFGNIESLMAQHLQKKMELARGYLDWEQMQEEAASAERRRLYDEEVRLREERTQYIEGLVNRLLSGQLNAQSILLLVAQEGQRMFSRLIAERIQAAIFGEQVETAAKVAGASARSGIGIAEAGAAIALKAATSKKSLLASAAEVFGNVYAYLSPYIGPLAAIPAGLSYAAVLAAGAIIPSARGGTEVQRDGLHMLHEKEVVLPAFWAQGLRSVINQARMGGSAPSYPSLGQIAASNPDGKGFAQQGFGGRPVYISGMDGPSIYEAVMRHGKEMGAAIHRIATDGHVTA